MPEPYALKEASTVLRGARQSNLPYLLDTMQSVSAKLDTIVQFLAFYVIDTEVRTLFAQRVVAFR